MRRPNETPSWCSIPSRRMPNAPLYVVLHSAGHDVHSCLACTTKVGNHDIYHSPPDFFALYLDCQANKGDWWWGINKYPGPEVGPTEKRVIDTVKWVIKQYGIDENRVYLCGNLHGRQRHPGHRHAPRGCLRRHQGQCSRRGQTCFQPDVLPAAARCPRTSPSPTLRSSSTIPLRTTAWSTRPRRLRQGHERAEIRALHVLGAVRPREQPREES